MDFNDPELIGAHRLQLESFDDSSLNGETASSEELQRENINLRRQVEDLRSSLQSSNMLRAVVHNGLPELSASVLDEPVQIGGEGQGPGSRPGSPHSLILSRGSAAIGSPMSRLIHRIEKFINTVKITSESHGENLEVIKDLHKRGVICYTEQIGYLRLMSLPKSLNSLKTVTMTCQKYY